MTNSYPRETVEFQPVTVTINGTAVTTGVTLAVVTAGSRPVTFSTPTTIGPNIGVMVTGLTPGAWEVYAKVASSPEIPVILCGWFQVV